MLNYLQQKYNFSDYQIAQLKYFFKSMISELSKFILMGIFFRSDLKVYLFSIGLMILLRTSTGGIHCKYYLSCLLVTFCYLFAALKCFKNLIIPDATMLILTIVSCIIVYICGPVTSKVHVKLDEAVIKKMRLRGTLTIAFYTIIILLFPSSPYIHTGFWIIVLHTIQLVIAKLINTGGTI